MIPDSLMKPLSGILSGAEFGLNLLNARNQRRMADQDRRMARENRRMAGENRLMAGTMDRLRQTMITRQARTDTSERLERFRIAAGSQRAAIGAMGIGGGRTARLFQQQAQRTFQRAQDAADMQQSMQRFQSRLQRHQETAQSWMQSAQARTQASQARARAAQSRINMFSAAINFGDQMMQAGQPGQVT